MHGVSKKKIYNWILRRQHGKCVINNITVNDMYRGLSEVNTMVRETSEVDLKYGIRYRGLSISEVIALLPRQGNSPSIEAVFWLLLTGDVPTQEQVAWLISDWTSRRQRRKEWWSGPGGGVVGSVLRTLPKNLMPLEKWCVSLMILDANKHAREALMKGAMSHTYWEYVYEDSMELLATLPAFAGLINEVTGVTNVSGDGDWAQFLVDCLGTTFKTVNARKKSAADFLRLYIVLNADEHGGIPGAHVTEIVGASRFDINQALAAGGLAYAAEPKTGTLQQCMEFQAKLQSSFGWKPEAEHLKNFMAALIEGSTLIGHKESTYCDPRYTALLNYARKHLPEDPNIKMSENITRILTSTMKNAKGKNIFPDQNAIAAPLFQFYGLKDMRFNHIIFCMSRALGDIASIICSNLTMQNGGG
ncbi:hypothetical protein KM043_013993 [Ampulex compressa]|nr:hypothetical protein KM043_013993 [Ampulex compressa]